jgi:His/Glu/Gln/Arg/opine family amino acid ABC transporter permease subunit
LGVLDIIYTYREGFASGLLVTFELALIVWGSGLIVGAALGTAAHWWPVAVGWPLRAVAFLLSGVPFLVVLYWVHFPLQTMLHIVVAPFITAALVLSTVNVAAVGEVWRGALNDFRSEYRIAAQVCGMTPGEIVRFIQLPLLLRQVIPTLLAIQVLMLQSTLFASLISVDEIFRVAQRIDSSIHRPIQIYTALAVFFLFLCLPAYALALWLRQRFTRDLSES